MPRNKHTAERFLQVRLAQLDDEIAAAASNLQQLQAVRRSYAADLDQLLADSGAPSESPSHLRSVPDAGTP